MPIANVTLNNTFDEWRTVTNQLISFVNDVDGGSLTQFYSNSAVLTVTENVVRGGKNYITLNVSSSVSDRSTLNIATANAVNIVFAALGSTDARIALVSNDANTINAVTNAAFIQANVARDHANAAFNAANVGSGLGAAFAKANTANITADLAYNQANTSYDRANVAYDLALVASGNVGPVISSTNAAFIQANTARDQANVSFTTAIIARDHANAAHATANAGFGQANTARIHANTAHATANAGLEQANTARNLANTSQTLAVAGLEQANTARVHANTAHASANAGLTQANTARIHANVAFERANAALPNTSGASFTGNLNFPTGNLTIGEGTTQGIRLHVHSWSDRANIFPEMEAMSGTQRILFNANTSFGAWNDLMLERDLSIIYTRGTSDDGANLIIGPWTDSSFGYKQDGAGRHGFNTMNPRHVLDANGSANISGVLFVSGVDVIERGNAIASAVNSYTVVVGTAGNNYTNTVGAAGNNYTNTVGAASNNYANTVGTAGNNYTNAVGAAGNNYTNIVGAAANGWANTVSSIGQQTIWVPAVGMYGRTSNGASSGTVETSTNKIMIRTLDFDTTSQEFAQFAIQMPKGWNEGTLISQFVWSHAATTTNFGVVWGIQAVAFANDDALDTAFGANTTVLSTGGTTNDIYISNETAPFTVAGLPGPEEYVVFQVFRNAANTSDTMAIDARLHGIKIHYTIDSAKDD